MISPLLLGIGALVTYRIARMLALEEGAFSIFSKLRSILGGEKQQHWLGRGVNCPLCIGFWLALPISWLLLGAFDVWGWLAIAGLQTFLQKLEL